MNSPAAPEGRGGWQRPFRTAELVRQRFFAHEQPIAAAALAYSLLFALFPVLLLVLSVASLFFTPVSGFDTLIDRLLGLPGTGTLVTDSFRSVFAHRDDFGWAGFFGLLVTSLGPIAIAEAGANRAWGSPKRGGWGRWPWLAAAALILMLLLGLGTVAVLWPLRSVRHVMSPELTPGAGQPLSITLVWIALLSLLVFVSAYRFLPTARVPWRNALRGGAAATVLWMLLVAGLSSYLTSVGDPGYRYAALGSVLAFITWGYGLSVVFLVGAEVSALGASMQDSRSGQL